MTPFMTVHIAAGAVGLLAGYAALAAAKGMPAHRAAGSAFGASMLAMAGVGAALAPFVPSPSTSLVGLFTCYLVATGWMAVRRPAGATARFERIAAVAAGFLVLANLVLAMVLTNVPRGTVDQLPAMLPMIFGGLAALALWGDVSAIRRGGLRGPDRLARHLWRMCAALLIAALSFFMGQQKVMPEAIQGSPLLFVPPLIAAGALAYWLVRVRRPAAPRIQTATSKPLPLR